MREAEGAGQEVASPSPIATGVTGGRLAARRAFALLAWLFVACIPIQVFLAGAALMADPMWWRHHRDFVHVFEFFPVLMLLLAFVGRLPRSLKWMSGAALFLIWAQYALVSVRPSIAAALHVVNALFIFGLGLEIARRSPWRG